MHHGYQASPVIQHALVLVHQQLALVREGNDPQADADFLTQNLPGHNVGVVLHAGDDDLISGLEELAAVAAGDQVQPLGRASHVDDLRDVGRVDEPADCLTTGFVVVGGPLAQGVHAAVHVGIVVQVVVADGVDNRPGLLRGGRVVQVDQGFAVDQLIQDREVPADPSDVFGGQGAGWGSVDVASGGGHERPPMGRAMLAEGMALRNRSSRNSRNGSSATVSMISLAKAWIRMRLAVGRSRPRLRM